MGAGELHIGAPARGAGVVVETFPGDTPPHFTSVFMADAGAIGALPSWVDPGCVTGRGVVGCAVAGFPEFCGMGTIGEG